MKILSCACTVLLLGWVLCNLYTIYNINIGIIAVPVFQLGIVTSLLFKAQTLEAEYPLFNSLQTRLAL